MSQDLQSSSFGWGVVAEPAILGKEHIILVIPIEQLPNISGNVETNPEDFHTSGKSASGKSYQLKTRTNSTINAQWLNRDNNRATPPQVQKGERVMLYRFSNDQTIYWEAANLDNNKRVREVVVDAYAAKPDKGATSNMPNDPDNTYTRTIDAENGIIEYRMTKANGEKSTWLFQMDGKSGIMTMTDQAGNIIQINGPKTVIDIINHAESHIQLDKQVINMYCKDTMNFHAEKTLNVETTTWNVKAQDVNWEIGGNVNWNVGGNVNFKIGGSFNVDCPTTNLKSVVNAGTLNVVGGVGSGATTMKGSMTVEGSSTFVAGASFSSPVNLSGGHSSADITGLNYRK